MSKLFLISVLGITSAMAGEWLVPMSIKGRPNNHPTRNPMVKASEELDFIGFQMKIDGEAQAGIRVRNAKHKRGQASITIDLGNTDLVVQRVDLMKPISKLTALGDGEHLIETFTHKGKPYEIYGKVVDGKLDNSLIVKSK